MIRMRRPYTSMNTAVWGTSTVFTASGLLIGTWVSRVPALVQNLQVSPGELGRALLALGIGSLVSMPLAGHACRRLGSRQWVALMAVIAGASIACVGLASDLVQLAAVLFVVGVAYGSWDVAMNVQGSAVDQLTGRERMPRYHACWSLGSILGAAVGSFAAGNDIGVGPHFAFAAAVATVATFAGLAGFVDERRTGREGPTGAPTAGGGGRGGGVVTRRLLMIGLFVLCGTMIEGAAGDWLALYLHTEHDLSEASAALGYTMFATAMTVVRFFGAPLTARLGRATALRVSGLLAVAGVLLTVLAPWPPLSFAGALLWGAGVCLVFPAAVSAAGESERPAESIALVTTIGYGSILIGPPLLGTLADAIGMGRTLLTLAVLAAAVAVLAPVIRRPDRVAHRPEPEPEPEPCEVEVDRVGPS